METVYFALNEKERDKIEEQLKQRGRLYKVFKNREKMLFVPRGKAYVRYIITELDEMI